MSVDRATFESSYAGEAPWDTGAPQVPFVAVAGRVESPILDAGCGTGEQALLFASLGHRVVGIDFVEEAIRRARAKAEERALRAEFLVMDARELAGWDRRFSTVIDSGLFHVFSDEDRRRYAEGLAEVISPGGRLYLACFSDEEPGTEGPRRVSRRELREAFAREFEVESIQRIRFEVRRGPAEHLFSEGGPKGWFAVLRRQG